MNAVYMIRGKFGFLKEILRRYIVSTTCALHSFSAHPSDMASSSVRLFMVGDVMLARGIDMIQEHSCDPKLYEGNGMNSHGYVELAEAKNGPVPSKRDRGPDYVWGDAIGVLRAQRPDVRIINLETSVTTSMQPWPGKGIHYKMHPKNVNILQAANIDCCVLSNNHTADWGMKGFQETLTTLRGADLKYCGAGFDEDEAQRPAIFPVPGKGRVLVFGVGHESSGVPDKWKAASSQEGLFMLEIQNTNKAISQLKSLVSRYKEDDDLIVLSIHWGGNWGYEVEEYHKKFAHAAIREAGIDVIHGHSSHHIKGVEVYQGKLIIYGCGDFINDYEGIWGHEEFRGDLALMYLADVSCGDGKLLNLQMIPTQTKKLCVNHACEKDVAWMAKTMARECLKLGCDVQKDGQQLKLVFT